MVQFFESGHGERMEYMTFEWGNYDAELGLCYQRGSAYGKLHVAGILWWNSVEFSLSKFDKDSGNKNLQPFKNDKLSNFETGSFLHGAKKHVTHKDQ